MPAILQFFQDLIIIKKKVPNVIVTDTRFGTVPVRLFRPKEVSSKPRRGIIFYHGGGAVCGSLGKEPPCVVGRTVLSKGQNLHTFS
jgi:arylacetamide deacetylase-like 3/4